MRWVIGAASVALLVGSLLSAPSAGASPTSRTSLRVGSYPSGVVLVSTDGRYRAQLSSGRLVVRDRAGRPQWASGRASAASSLRLTSSGDLRLTRGRRVYWTSRTAGGKNATLSLRNDGVLALTAGRLLVWSTTKPTRCPRSRGKSIRIDLSEQFARMCANGRQVRETAVTTGASKRGWGTPTGSWRIYAKQRNTVLRPSSGGRYPVKYWVPYDGAYGIHDSSWQKIAYGSSKYRTKGSHGCTHLPRGAMAWFFHWARVGTRVTIRR